MTKGWKVISTITRASALTSVHHGGVIYPPKKAARPKANCGPLAVFITNADASAFLVNHCMGSQKRIVECSYEKSKENRLYDMRGRVLSGIYLPPGTDFASEVTCLE